MTLEGLFTRAREELLPHMGHRIVIVYYGDKGDPVNIAIECMRCGQVLIDFTQEESKQCGNCGHSEEDHGSFDGSGHCWNGSGHGNTCACKSFDQEQIQAT